MSLTACATMVYVPVPMSWVAQEAKAVPSARRDTRASQSIFRASQLQAAMPQPMISSPSRIEPGSGVRFDQPNFSAPRSKASMR